MWLQVGWNYCIGTSSVLKGQCTAVFSTYICLFPQNYYYSAECKAVHPADQTVECVSDDGIRFYCEYDALAIATGSQVRCVLHSFCLVMQTSHQSAAEQPTHLATSTAGEHFRDPWCGEVHTLPAPGF